jgi:hypothetical protein
MGYSKMPSDEERWSFFNINCVSPEARPRLSSEFHDLTNVDALGI